MILCCMCREKMSMQSNPFIVAVIWAEDALGRLPRKEMLP